MKISRKRKLYAIIVIAFLMILLLQIKKEWSKQVNQENFQITEEPDLVILDSEEVEDSRKNYNFQRIMEKDYSCLDCDEIAELKALIRNGYYEWKFSDVNGDNKEELILCEKQEDPGKDIRCIIDIFTQTSDGVKCVFWHTGDGSGDNMNIIDKKSHNELIRILNELITTIELMRTEKKDYLLDQNQEEAIEWLKFLCEHTDKEELKTLEDEIADRFVAKFDVEIDTGELDGRRVSLMKEYLIKSNEFLIFKNPEF